MSVRAARTRERRNGLLRLALTFGLLMAVNVIAQVAFKQAAVSALPLQADWPWLQRVLGQPWVYGALVAYFAAFCLWMTLLRDAPIGPAFAASHLDVVLVMLVSACVFGETLTTGKLVGAGLIVAGILFLTRSQSAS